MLSIISMVQTTPIIVIAGFPSNHITIVSSLVLFSVYVLQAAAEKAAERDGGEISSAKSTPSVTPADESAVAAASPATPGGTPSDLANTEDPGKDKVRLCEVQS